MEVVWVKGHKGCEGNTLADEEAKQAAKGESSLGMDLPKFLAGGPLPRSVSAVKQEYGKELKVMWGECWQESDRYPKMADIDPGLLSGSF